MEPTANQKAAKSAGYYRLRRGAYRIFIHVIAVGLSAIFLFPLLWAIGASLKPLIEVYRFPPTFFYWPPQWANYPEAIAKLPFFGFISNTITITIAATAGQLLSGSLVGYAFARLNWKGRDFWFICLLATMMLPHQVLLIPHYLIYKNLGWVNTYKPLIIPAWLGGSAFYIFLLRQFFMGIPGELVDAARIDGASELRIYGSLFLPLAKPVMLTIGVLCYMQHWKEFMMPLIYLSDYARYPIALGLRMYQQVEGGSFVHYLMAASAVALCPLLIIFFVTQRYITKNLLLTGSKS